MLQPPSYVLHITPLSTTVNADLPCEQVIYGKWPLKWRGIQAVVESGGLFAQGGANWSPRAARTAELPLNTKRPAAAGLFVQSPSSRGREMEEPGTQGVLATLGFTPAALVPALFEVAHERTALLARFSAAGL